MGSQRNRTTQRGRRGTRAPLTVAMHTSVVRGEQSSAGASRYHPPSVITFPATAQPAVFEQSPMEALNALREEHERVSTDLSRLFRDMPDDRFPVLVRRANDQARALGQRQRMIAESIANREQTLHDDMEEWRAQRAIAQQLREEAARMSVPHNQPQPLSLEEVVARRSELRTQGQGNSEEYHTLGEQLVGRYNPNIVSRTPMSTAVQDERYRAVNETALRQWNANVANFREKPAGPTRVAPTRAQAAQALANAKARLPQVRAAAQATKAAPVLVSRPPRTTLNVAPAKENTAPRPARTRADMEKAQAALPKQQTAAQARADRLNSAEGMTAYRDWRNINVDMTVLNAQMRATAYGSAAYRAAYEQHTALRAQSKAALARYNGIASGKIKVGPPRTEPLTGEAAPKRATRSGSASPRVKKPGSIRTSATKAATKTPASVTLQHVGLVRRNDRVRSNGDARRFVAREIHSFRGSDGVEYRKSFEMPVGAHITVPASGTHEDYRARQSA